MLFSRVGGEEFAAVLPNTDVVTVSIGVAMIEPKRGDNIKDLIEQSDQALYRLKEGSRNIVATAKLHPHRVEPLVKHAETPPSH